MCTGDCYRHDVDEGHAMERSNFKLHLLQCQLFFIVGGIANNAYARGNLHTID